MSLRNMAQDSAIKFAPFGSEIELPFYSALSAFKIDVDRLDDSARPVLGLYEPKITKPDDSCRMQILGNALTSEDVPSGNIRAEGKIKNFNTIEDFKNADKSAILQTAAKQIWDAINDGTIYSIPSLLSSFTILSFANLKKYTFTYWFAFPALHSDPVWRRAEAGALEQLNGKETTFLVDEVGTWRYATDPREHGFFLAKRVRPTHVSKERPTTPGPADEIGYEWKIGSLRQFETGFFDGIAKEDQFVAFVDPSTYPDNPGWMLRNLLVLIRRRFKLNKVQILCYRDTQARRHEARSRILVLETEPVSSDSDQMPKVTGWERNSIGKLTPKVTDLSMYMDPEELAKSAADLNLKLIKWRIAPDLNLDKIKETKCLLLGAGTLGTYVSRLLMGWGVKKITFVDNASVSFSNPVRQPLFDFKDCIDGGAKKAYRAAEALAEIFPGVDSTGFVMSVPMLGHPITDEQSSKKDFETLDKLFDEHDAIFLLMDTRESRWLPTVMGKAKNKLVLNAALGFDTWVVMRHGVFAKNGDAAALGCYFCNDVVAPADSVKDQTLDQQCTVTRPGIAPTASAQLVELMVSVLQHPDGAHAGAPKSTKNETGGVQYDRDPPNHPLGIIPHQIRGFMSTFQNLPISGQSYDCCSACSPKIVDEYKRSGWDFIQKALTEKDYVSELSGLAEVQRQAEAAADDVDWESEGGVEEEGEGLDMGGAVGLHFLGWSLRKLSTSRNWINYVSRHGFLLYIIFILSTMRSQLTRSVFRQLLSNEGLVFHCPTHTASLSRRWMNRAPPSAIRPSQRRTLFGFTTKPPREAKEPSIDPGLGKMSEVTHFMKIGARLPPKEDMVRAWRLFFNHKLKNKSAVNRLQAQHILDTFKCLKSIESSPVLTSLNGTDLGIAAKSLTRTPSDGADLHNELARLLYAELTQMSPTEKLKRENFVSYITVLSRSGDAAEARDLVLAHCKSQTEKELSRESKTDPSSESKKLWEFVLKGFSKERKPVELTQTFEIAAELYGLQYDADIHKIISDYFSNQNDVEATKLWFSKPIISSQNPSEIIPPSAQSLGSILRFCIRNNELEWCTSIFKDILSTNPNKRTWDVILQWAAGGLGKGVEDVERMMEVMVRRNPDDESMRPDTETINGLVGLAESLKDPYLAERYISLAQKWGIKLNARTYIHQISYRADANDLRGAQSAYEALQTEEVTRDEDQPAINKYIRALCAAKDLNYSLITSIITDIEERKKLLEADTVASLSLMYLQRQEIDEVIDLIQTQCWHYTIEERARIRDAFVAYCLNRYNSTAKAWDAYTVFRQLFNETGIDIRTQMMNEFFRRRRSDMACHVFGHMRQHDSPTRRPVLETYVQCFEGIAKHKDREHLDMVHNMLKLDSTIEPNTKLYNALMLAYTACDDADRALMFWTDITTSIEGPSYNSLDIVFWACSQKPFGETKAKEIWGKMRRMQVEITKEVFTSYLGAIASAGLWDEAKALVEGMGKEFGFKMDIFILGSLYNTLANQSRRDTCEKWAEEHHPTVMAELRKLGRVKKRETGERFFQMKVERRA